MNDDSLVDLFFSPGGILETTNDMLSNPLTKSRSLIEGLLQTSNGAVGSPSVTQMSESQYRAIVAAAQESKKGYGTDMASLEHKEFVPSSQDFFHNPNLTEAECAALDGTLEDEPTDDYSEMSPNTTTYSTSFSHRSAAPGLHIATHTAPEALYPSLISPENAAADVRRSRSSSGGSTSFSFSSVPAPPPPGMSPSFMAQPSPRTAATVNALSGRLQSMGIASAPQDEYRPKSNYAPQTNYYASQPAASPAPAHPYSFSQSPTPSMSSSTASAFANVDVSLHLMSISVNGCFAGNEPGMIPARQAIYELIKTKNAHVIFLNNTGISDDKQLTQIRNEVKLWFKTESAMWASLKVIPAPEEAKSIEDPETSLGTAVLGSPLTSTTSHAGGEGGGTAVLVLGPLAPRTGWIISDSHGRYLSATSRVKPGLPEVAFVSVDFPFEPLSPHWTSAMTELSTLISEEQQKGKSVIVAGRFSPINAENAETSSADAAMEWFRAREVYMSNISQFCNASSSGATPGGSKSNQMECIFISKLSVPKQSVARSMNPVHDIKVLDIREVNNSAVIGVTSRPPMLLSLEVKDWPKKVYMTGDIPPQYCQPPPVSKKPKPYKPLVPMYGGPKYGMGGGPMMGHEANTSKYYPYGAAPLASPHAPVVPPMAANVYEELQQWRDCTLKGMNNLQLILQKYPWGTSRYVQLRELLFLMQQWAFSVGGGKVGSFGFADSQSMYVLNELSSLSPNDFMARAENLLGQILTRWKLNVDAALLSHSSMRRPGGY